MRKPKEVLTNLKEKVVKVLKEEEVEEAKAPADQAKVEKEVTTTPRARKITVTIEPANREKPRISVGKTSFTIFNARPISIKPKGSMRIPGEVDLGAGIVREKSRGKRGRQHIKLE